MSGTKYSDFQLKKERQERLRLSQTAVNAHAEALALKKRITAMLSGASEGLRSTFRQETQAAEKWVKGLRLPEVKGLGADSNVADLKRICTQLDRAVTEGRGTLKTLAATFTRKADDMGKRLARQLVETEQLYLQREALLKLWFNEEQVQTWSGALQTARGQVEKEQYADAERAIAALQQELTTQGGFAATQEEKHQKRMYLLQALRRVCADMGFEEVSSPHYESEGKRGSRIRFKVDTLDRGQIEFMLSLDQISSSSELLDGHCFEEFTKLQDSLQSEFGIQTQFKLSDGTPLPELKRKGELDLPDDASQTMQA